MQNYNKNLSTWAKFAISKSEKDSREYSALIDNLNPLEVREMLGILAGYLGATTKGKELLKSLICTGE